MPFHRYKDPSYDLIGGSFPGTIGAETYDRINVVSEGVGGGDGSANADNAKLAPSPNVGTYFVAFGEDATSSFANRGMRALGQNTDFLDDMVRGNIPGFYAYPPVSLVGASSFQIMDDVFVGDGIIGVPQYLVRVVDQTTGLNPILSSGLLVQVTGIYDSTNTSSVLGTGFYTNPTIRLSSYYTGDLLVYYGKRTSLARTIEQPERDLRWEQGGSAYSIAQDAWSLSRHGLNERYRRSRLLSAVITDDFTPDTPGAGAVIKRDGQAVTVRSLPVNYDVDGYPDDFLAQFKSDTPVVTGTSVIREYSGRIGFLDVDWYRERDGYSDHGDYGHPRAAFMSAVLRNQGGDTGPDVLYTKIPLDSPATLNPSAGSGVYSVRLTSGYFKKNVSGTDRSAIRLGVDMLLIERPSYLGGRKELYIITTFYSDTDVAVSDRDGLGAPAFGADEAALVTWVQPQFEAGPKKLAYYSRGYLGEDDEAQNYCAELFAASTYRRRAGLLATYETYALTWGGHNDTTGEEERHGHLLGDGSIECYQVTANLHSSNYTNVQTSTSAYQIFLSSRDPDLHGTLQAQHMHVEVDTSSNLVQSVSLQCSVDYVPKAGHRFVFTVTVSDPASTITVEFFDLVSTYTTRWKDDGFSLSAAIPKGVVGTWKFEGLMVYDSSSNEYWMLLTRSEYI